MARKRAWARVSGRVQGVSFRWYTQQEAQKLGLSGWVRNRRDGTVELECEGEAARVDALLAWLERGSPSSRVENVERRELDADEANAALDFRIAPTV